MNILKTLITFNVLCFAVLSVSSVNDKHLKDNIIDFRTTGWQMEGILKKCEFCFWSGGNGNMFEFNKEKTIYLKANNIFNKKFNINQSGLWWMGGNKIGTEVYCPIGKFCTFKFKYFQDTFIQADFTMTNYSTEAISNSERWIKVSSKNQHYFYHSFYGNSTRQFWYNQVVWKAEYFQKHNFNFRLASKVITESFINEEKITVASDIPSAVLGFDSF